MEWRTQTWKIFNISYVCAEKSNGILCCTRLTIPLGSREDPICTYVFISIASARVSSSVIARSLWALLLTNFISLLFGSRCFPFIKPWSYSRLASGRMGTDQPENHRHSYFARIVSDARTEIILIYIFLLPRKTPSSTNGTCQSYSILGHCT